MNPDEQPKSEGTFSIKRYGNMSVYETIGALEVVKANLLERLGRVGQKEESE